MLADSATTSHLFRLLMAGIIGLVATFCLLWMMQQMVTGERDQSMHNRQRPVIQFVRLKKSPQTQFKNRTPPPDLPPLSDPPPPTVPRLMMSKNTLTAPIPDLDIYRPQTAFSFDSPFLGPVMSDPVFAGPIDRDFIPLARIPPHYPYRALRRGIEGWVKVSFLITEQGKVDNLVLVDSNPPKLFDQAALKAVLRWTFKPRIHNGKPVATRAEQMVNFKLKK
ncbi:MAG: energy transducer TonB [Magnetococcales bacterium]|nr:energy transducer TonB [Magnetococcales bacterium]